MKVKYDENEYLWNLLLIVVPILVMVALRCVFYGDDVYMVFHRQFGLKNLIRQWRLFFFTFFYIYIYTILFAFEIERIVQTGDQYDSYLAWVQCYIVESAFVKAGFPPILSCDLKEQISFPLWYIVVFNASCQGIVVFLIFGTSLPMYKVTIPHT